MTILAQRSFAGGELAPSLYARCDTVKYVTGLRSMRNFFLMRHGGAANRAGTGFVAEVKDSTKQVRLQKFVFNALQTYVLEFGDLYMRVHRNGVQLTEAAKTITGATQANPCVLTINSHGYNTGDEIQVASVGGMTQLNGRNFKVVVLGANTFSLKYMDGSAVNSTAFAAYTSGGTASKVYEITTPYEEDELSTLQFVQSADVVTIVHQNHEPRELQRTGHTTWTLTSINNIPEIAAPDNLAASAGAAGPRVHRYVVTAVSEETGEESTWATIFEPFGIIGGATAAAPVALTVTAHGYSNGDRVNVDGMDGQYAALNGRIFVIGSVTANTFELLGTDGTSYGLFTGGGTTRRNAISISGAAASPSAPHTVSWSMVTGAKEYNVYKELNGIFGFLGVAYGTSFEDVGVDPDTSDSAPLYRNPFSVEGSYPSVVSYIQQRLTMANTADAPETVWMSRSGRYKNFTVSSPIQDDDAVTFTMSGRQVNQVRHLIELVKPVIFTDSGAWVIEGDGAGIIKPTAINPKQHAYNGSSVLPPLIIDNTALYVQARGSKVRDLGYSVNSDGYAGSDLTIFSSHLFDDYTLVDWDYQENPHSIAWAVRDDGTLLGITYVREHQLWGWHRHDTDGLFENVCVVPEGTEDVPYFVVKRTIDGVTKRYIERAKSRQVSSATIKDFVGMDCSLSYDGRNSNSGHTMTLSGGTTWSHEETLTLTSSAGFFTAADVGNAVQLTGEDGTVIRFTITGYTSATVVTGRAHRTVPVAMRAAAISDWAKAVDTISGLWHLEGKQVSIFGDALVVANPNNAAYVTQTVTDGTIELEKPYAVIHVGLPYTSDLETLDIDIANGETLINKMKSMNSVSVMLEASRGLWVGGAAPASDTDFSRLIEMKIRNQEGYNDPVSLLTGSETIVLKSEWNSNGRVFLRQTDPLPAAVLSVSPEGLVPIRRQ